MDNSQTEIQENILKIIYSYSEKVGEDPLEYQGRAMPNVIEFVMWCKDKDYIGREEYWRYMDNPFSYEMFQLFNEKEDGGLFDDYKDGYKALAEFISLSKNRVRHFYDNFNDGSRR